MEGDLTRFLRAGVFRAETRKLSVLSFGIAVPPRAFLSVLHKYGMEGSDSVLFYPTSQGPTRKQWVQRSGCARWPSGIAITRSECVDAVLLDFNMPGMNGDQVGLTIMKIRPTVPVVICSGFLDEIPESLKWFADAVLSKADGPEALLSAIARVVRSRATKKRTPVRRRPRGDERLSA
jgi:CheY-like chemotaxis protein